MEYRNIGITAGAGLVLPLILAGWLSTGRHGRLICDAQQKVLWYNQSFQILSQKTARFLISRDQLVFTNKNDQSLFINFIEHPSADDAAFWLQDKDGLLKVAVQCQRIKAFSVPDCFGLRIAENTDFLASDFRHFEAYLNLTRQETMICRLMLQGRTVQDIVEICGKSQDTVRFHVRNIYRKMGISSREELFANLRHFLFG